MAQAFAQSVQTEDIDEEVAVPIPDEPAEEVATPIDGPSESLFPPFDIEAYPSHLFWIAISFGLLYFFVNRLVVPQVGGILEDRRDRIASDLGEASRLSRETDEVIAVYEQELAEARQKAYAIAQERREEIKAEQARQQAETEDGAAASYRRGGEPDPRTARPCARGRRRDRHRGRALHSGEAVGTDRERG